MGQKLSQAQLTIESFPKFRRVTFLEMADCYPSTDLAGLIAVSHFSTVCSLAAEETPNLPPSPPPSPASEQTVTVEEGKAFWTF